MLCGEKSLQIDLPVGSELGLEAGGLSRGEFGHALVVGVVHVVIDGLKRNGMRNQGRERGGKVYIRSSPGRSGQESR